MSEWQQTENRPTHERLDRLETNVFWGNGLPGLTTRMAQAEGRMNRIEEAQKAIDVKFWAIIVMLLMTLTGLMVDIAMHKVQ